jgi:ankyrin repeat protein
MAAFGSLDGLRRMIKEDSSLVNAGTGDVIDQWSPLWEAAFWRRKDSTEFLLKEGADANARTRTRQTPILGAVQGGSFEISRLLVESGAKVSARFEDGRTALHEAARVGSKAIVELLLSEDIGLEVVNNTGKTALHFAAWARSREVVEVLLAHKAKTTAKDQNNRTPLDMALLENEDMSNERKSKGPNPEIVSMLKEAARS